MIITLTGKPCSGKGTTAKAFCSKYNFEIKSVGDMMRSIATQYGYSSILDFQTNYPKMHEIDNMVDKQTEDFGKENLNKNIVFDSRLAWHFIPKSFKVFIDVDWNIAGERLLNSNRSTEQVETIEEATTKLKERWNAENERYKKLYNTDNLNLTNYDFVISSNNKTPEEIADEIYNAYLKFMQTA